MVPAVTRSNSVSVRPSRVPLSVAPRLIAELALLGLSVSVPLPAEMLLVGLMIMLSPLSVNAALLPLEIVPFGSIWMAELSVPPLPPVATIDTAASVEVMVPPSIHRP